MAKSTGLGSFLISLETDGDLLAAYKADPVQTMAARNLSIEEQNLVISGSNKELVAYLGDGEFWVIRPIPQPQPGPQPLLDEHS